MKPVMRPASAGRPSATSNGCAGTLDLLHLAAMAAMGIDRLFTTDRAQSAVARSLGLAVTMPGVSGE